jgi:hypothetical protein
MQTGGKIPIPPTEKLVCRPSLTAVEIILTKASITMTNNKGDRGSLCLNSRELLKKKTGGSAVNQN